MVVRHGCGLTGSAFNRVERRVGNVKKKWTGGEEKAVFAEQILGTGIRSCGTRSRGDGKAK
jgi:hypothetical protein